MHGHDVIILEEPVHDDFIELLDGNIEIEDHLLGLDTDYPEFTLGQYQLLQEFSKVGKKIFQVEPYLQHLLHIQYFLAGDHTPEEIPPNTIAHAVYCSERDTTGLLINYYKEVQGDDFKKILSSMNSFAKADAARFVLRDSLRVKGILNVLDGRKDTYIEAGSIHLLLYRLLAERLPNEWQLHLHSIDREVLKILKKKGSFFSPGDKLTLQYIYGRDVSQKKWEMFCAQSLIYSKIIKKEESLAGDQNFPHALNELESIAAVQQLSTTTCETLFSQIRHLSSENAADVVKTHIKRQKTSCQ
ncbi:hypothetical protein LA52FAK_42910 [Desulforhopalus sp. 52FAK]